MRENLDALVNQIFCFNFLMEKFDCETDNEWELLFIFTLFMKYALLYIMCFMYELILCIFVQLNSFLLCWVFYLQFDTISSMFMDKLYLHKPYKGITNNFCRKKFLIWTM